MATSQGPVAAAVCLMRCRGMQGSLGVVVVRRARCLGALPPRRSAAPHCRRCPAAGPSLRLPLHPAFRVVLPCTTFADTQLRNGGALQQRLGLVSLLGGRVLLPARRPHTRAVCRCVPWLAAGAFVEQCALGCSAGARVSAGRRRRRRRPPRPHPQSVASHAFNPADPNQHLNRYGPQGAADKQAARASLIAARTCRLFVAGTCPAGLGCRTAGARFTSPEPLLLGSSSSSSPGRLAVKAVAAGADFAVILTWHGAVLDTRCLVATAGGGAAAAARQGCLDWSGLWRPPSGRPVAVAAGGCWQGESLPGRVAGLVHAGSSAALAPAGMFRCSALITPARPLHSLLPPRQRPPGRPRAGRHR